MNRARVEPGPEQGPAWDRPHPLRRKKADGGSRIASGVAGAAVPDLRDR